jgi:hypothetical protein
MDIGTDMDMDININVDEDMDKNILMSDIGLLRYWNKRKYQFPALSDIGIGALYSDKISDVGLNLLMSDKGDIIFYVGSHLC